jgi:hypothetical protein
MSTFVVTGTSGALFVSAAPPRVPSDAVPITAPEPACSSAAMAEFVTAGDIVNDGDDVQSVLRHYLSRSQHV